MEAVGPHVHDDNPAVIVWYFHGNRDDGRKWLDLINVDLDLQLPERAVLVDRVEHVGLADDFGALGDIADGQHHRCQDVFGRARREQRGLSTRLRAFLMSPGGRVPTFTRSMSSE